MVKPKGFQSWAHWANYRGLRGSTNGNTPRLTGLSHKLIMEEYKREMDAFPDWSPLATKYMQSQRAKALYYANPELMKERAARYHQKKKDTEEYRAKRREKHRAWCAKNADVKAASTKKWLSRNPERKRIYRRRGRLQMMKKPAFRILCHLRSRLRELVKKKPGEHHAHLIGCSTSFLREYLEAKFRPGMTWENYGTRWHVDHIKPCSSFNMEDRSQRFECFHYSNLQPLFAEENLAKSNKLDWVPPWACAA